MKVGGGGSVSWPAPELRRAKDEKKYLVVIGFDGQPGGVDGAVIHMALADKAFVTKLNEFLATHRFQVRKPCPHPARNGVHELYVHGDRYQCRACGEVIE